MGYTQNLLKPKLTIGIALYNGEYFITKAIESVLKQSYSNYEIFISDDN